MNADITGNEISLFLLVLSRVSGLVLSAPIVGDMQVPRVVKAGLAIMLAVLLVGLPSVTKTQPPTDLMPFAVVVLTQLAIGITLGFVARTIFLAVQTAGGIVSLQVGLSIASVLNPLTRQPDSVLSQLYTVIAAMTFLAINGEAWVVAALARSFDLAPISGAGISPGIIGHAVTDTIAITQLGLQLALPIGASLLVANLVMGIISRSLPQLNLFMLSMPLNILLGLVALLGSLAGMMLVLSHLMNNIPRAMLDLLPFAH